MRFTTLLPMLLAASLAQAQFGGGRNGGQNNGGNNNNGQNNGGNNNNGQNNGQNNDNNNGGNNNNNGNNNGGNNNNNGGNLALNADLVQTNSQSDGLDDGAEAGQAASATDDANFINFCQGKTLTNGLQVREGSCNGIVMGEIPASNRMVSAVFVSPKDGDNIGENESIDFSVNIANLQAGSFTNPDVTYYAAPQALQGGQVVGHTHITVQDMNGNKNPNNPLDAETFAFFKGINDNGNGQGVLTAQLAAGLPAGVYRACSMTSSSNHQPVLMPVAQRGAQDDCIRFTVGGDNNGGNNGGNNNNNNNGNGGNNNNGQNNGGNNGGNNNNNGQNNGGNNGQQGQGQQGGQGQGGQGGQGQGGQGGQGGANRGRGRGRFNRPKFAARDFVA